jgi:hypothetical protein
MITEAAVVVGGGVTKTVHATLIVATAITTEAMVVGATMTAVAAMTKGGPRAVHLKIGLSIDLGFSF